MARLEEYTATPIPVSSTPALVNTAISVVRAAPGNGMRWMLKKLVVSAWGTGAPSVAPLLSISGGGLANPVTVLAAVNGGYVYAEIEIPESVMLLGENSGVTYSFPALGASYTSTMWIVDRVVQS